MDVDNELKVRFPRDFTTPEDADITNTIDTKLLWDNQVNSSNISIQKVDGIVTLSGTVETFWEKTRAEDIAFNTNGVIDIINDLSVSPVKAVVDKDIENDIKSAYRRSVFIDDDNIDVNVENGIVTLTGTVSGAGAKTRAHNIAMYTSGVVDVMNNLIVV